MTAPAADDFIPDPQPAAGGSAPGDFVPDADQGTAAPATETPAEKKSFLARAWDSISGGAAAIKHVVGENVRSPAEMLKDPLALPPILSHPEQRREFERGVSDVTTAGYGTRLAARIGNALGDHPDYTDTAGKFHPSNTLDETKHFSASPTAGDTHEPSQVEAADAAAAPGYRTVGQFAGAALPGVSSAAGKVAGKVISPLASGFARLAGDKVVSKLASVPFAGPALATAAEGVGGAAKGLATYEAAAPVLSAINASSQDHRAEAAREAAEDPAGLLMSGAAEGVPAAVGAAEERGGRAIVDYAARAQKAANDWIAKDLQGEAKGASTPTARKQMIRAADNFPELIGRDQELRDSIADARHGGVDKIAKANDIVSRRLDEVQEPKEDLYRSVDSALPAGGVRAGDVVKGYRSAIEDLRASGHDYDAKIAAELERRVGLIEGARDWGAEKQITGLSSKAQADIAQLETVRANVAKRPGFDTSDIDQQIAALKATGTPATVFDPDHIVSTRQLRKLVTDAQRTAFEGEGGLNGTERYNRAIEVASTPARILDEHLADAAGKVPDAVKSIESMDRDTSTLLAAKKVLVQRLDHAKLNAQGAGGVPVVPHSVRQLVHGSAPLGLAATAYMGHPALAAVGAAMLAAPAVKRFVDTRMAKFAATPRGQQVLARLVHTAGTGGNIPAAIERAVAAGVPTAVAQRMADISRQTFAAAQSQQTTAEATP